MDKKNIRQFMVSRFFRLWPALAVVLAAWAFVLGPIFSTYSLREYFSDSAVYEYFLRGLIMNIRCDLPGVFQDNALKAANGPLWSIPFEVYAYIVLIAMFLLNVLNSKRLSAIIVMVILIDPIIGNKLIFTWLPQNPEVALLAPCFGLGSLFALFKNKIEIHLAGFFGVWILLYLFKHSTYNFYFFYLAFFYSIILISSHARLLKFKPTVDISYGVSIYGVGQFSR